MFTSEKLKLEIIWEMNAGGKWRSCGEKVVSLLGSPLIFEDRKSELGVGV